MRARPECPPEKKGGRYMIVFEQILPHSADFGKAKACDSSLFGLGVGSLLPRTVFRLMM
jgi:hypothetical protein